MRNSTLYYRRPPDRLAIIETRILEETSNLVVMQHTIKTSKPLEVNGIKVLDDGYNAVWFVYQGEHHDIGVISDPTGNFTGYYCDAILPVISRNGIYDITDLFLDLWISPDGQTTVLDEDEFFDAKSKGWISDDEARIAWEEICRMIRGVREGNFPPDHVRRYASMLPYLNDGRIK